MTKTVKIIGMHCPACAMGVEGAIEKLSFVDSVKVSHETGLATIEAKDEKYDFKKIADAVKKAGFSAQE